MKSKAVILDVNGGAVTGRAAVSARAQQPVNTPKAKEFRIERSMSKEAVACIECHKREHPGFSPIGPAAVMPAPTSPAWTATRPSNPTRMSARNTTSNTNAPINKYGTAEYKVPGGRGRDAQGLLPLPSG